MPVPDFPLAGKIALVTGGGSGIGLSIATLFAARGAKVVITDLRLNDEAAAFVASHREVVVFERCDVAKRSDQERVVEVARERWGDVPDVWVSSAGLFEPSHSNFWLDTEAPTDAYATLAVNTTAPLKLTRLALRALLARNKPGVVLAVASIAGYGPGAYAVPLYCASKHAVVGFTRAMRKADVEEGVKVVCLCPGVVRTPLWTPGSAATGGSATAGGGATAEKRSAPVNLLKDFDYDPSTILEPEAVARAAAELVERGEYGGGTVLEVTTGGTRVVPEWNADPPPGGKLNTGAPAEIVPPVQVEVGEYLAGERGRGVKARL